MTTPPRTALDTSAWIEAYPLRGAMFREAHVLIEIINRLNISHALVGSFQSLFWEDNFTSYEYRITQITDNRLEICPVANPTMPDQINYFITFVKNQEIVFTEKTKLLQAINMYLCPSITTELPGIPPLGFMCRQPDTTRLEAKTVGPGVPKHGR